MFNLRASLAFTNWELAMLFDVPVWQWCPSTILHGVVTYKAVACIFSAVEISNSIWRVFLYCIFSSCVTSWQQQSSGMMADRYQHFGGECTASVLRICSGLLWSWYLLAKLYCASWVSCHHTCAGHVQILSPINRINNFTVYVVRYFIGTILKLILCVVITDSKDKRCNSINCCLLQLNFKWDLGIK